MVVGVEEPCCLPASLDEPEPVDEALLLTGGLVIAAPEVLAPPQAERSSVKSSAKGKRYFHEKVVRMCGIRDIISLLL